MTTNRKARRPAEFSRMVMENRPVDPGSIQGSHRPISFIRIKHRTRADDILCKTVDKSPKVYTQLAREGVVLTQDNDNI